MNRAVFCTIVLSTFSALPAFSQAEPTPTPVRLVVTDNMPKVKPAAPRPTPMPIIVGSPNQTAPAPTPTPIIVGSPSPTVMAPRPIPTPFAPAAPPTESLTFKSLSFREIKNLLADAKRQMQSRPIATAASDGRVMTDFVRVAFHDPRSKHIDYVVLAKEAFLSIKEEKIATSQNGKALRIRTIRGNGVNTPLVIIDERGETQLPLLVQYPVERGGKYMETAYYMSTHPGLVTPEVVGAGRMYVRNVIEIARERLREKGITVTPKIADIAERLATVEHVDHQRFRTEMHGKIFDDIFTLYALNEGQTYRYSVSSAGAGGMVQMIPSTYRMVRSWHPNVPLTPDFVEGMRNHVNAAQAMLLYMNRTWADLIASPTVNYAFSSGLATQEQLMAAGYNSNPARLAGYINRGGENWTGLIPRETRIYLQIYDSIERNVPMVPRTR